MAKQGVWIGILAMLASGCDAAEVRPHVPEDDASVTRGKAAAVSLGCGACHVLPGVRFPRGAVGPPLDNFAARAMIAGRLPNRPDVLARFVRDAPALAPGTAMPAIAMTDTQAHDIAAWLQSADGE